MNILNLTPYLLPLSRDHMDRFLAFLVLFYWSFRIIFMLSTCFPSHLYHHSIIFPHHCYCIEWVFLDLNPNLIKPMLSFFSLLLLRVILLLIVFAFPVHSATFFSLLAENIAYAIHLVIRVSNPFLRVLCYTSSTSCCCCQSISLFILYFCYQVIASA